MNLFLAAVQLLSIIMICIYEYNKKNISVFLWGVLLVMFGIPHFISILFSISEYSSDILIKASLFVIMFNFVYITSKILISLAIKRKILSKKLILENNKLNNDNMIIYTNRDNYLLKIFFTLLILSFIILLLYIYNYLGSIDNVSWGSLYTLNNKLGFKSPLKYANVIFFSAGGIILIYKVANKKFHFFFAIGIVILYALITGNRITILPAIVSLIISYMYKSNYKLNIKKIIFFSITGFLVVYLVYGLRLLRIYGGIYNFITSFNIKEMNNKIFDMMINGDGELALRNVFYYFIKINNNFPNFNKGHTYIRVLLMPIPTAFSFGIKPPDFAITMGSAELNNVFNTTYSTHPTLYGDVFANLWWFGILLGIFWAMLTIIVEIYINRRNYIVRNLLKVLYGVVYVIVGRGSVYNGLFIGYSSSIIIGLMYLVSRKRIKFK